MTNYSFTIGLLDASQTANALQIWQSGTLTLDTSAEPAVSGVLTLPGYYKDPIPFSGSVVAPDQQAGPAIQAAGKSPEVEVTLTLSYRYDGFLFSGSYLAGLVSMLDYSAQETYVYVVQGSSPQGPFGAAFRGSAGAADKRKQRP